MNLLSVSLTYLVWQQYDGLFPDNSSALVPHVVNLIIDYPSNLSHNFTATVQHAPQDLSCHDQTCCCRVDSDVACHKANVSKLSLVHNKRIRKWHIYGSCVSTVEARSDTRSCDDN